MKVICLSGYSGSGKTFIADLIKKWCKKHSHNFKLLSFSKSLVGADISRKTRHEVAQNDIGEIIREVHLTEKQNYEKLVQAEKENLFTETVIVIDDVNYLDDLKFLLSFNTMNVFVDASQRLDPEKLNSSRDHLARAVTTGKYSINMFHVVVDNNSTKAHMTKLMDMVTPNLLYR